MFITSLVACFTFSACVGFSPNPGSSHMLGDTPAVQDVQRKTLKQFAIQNTGANNIYRTLSTVINETKNLGVDFISYDPTNNSIVARGDEEGLNRLEAMIKQFDVLPIKIQLDVKVEVQNNNILENMGLIVNNGVAVSLDDRANGLLLTLELRSEKKDEVVAKLTWRDGKENRVSTATLTRKDSRVVFDFASELKDRKDAPRVIVDFKNLIPVKKS